MHIAHRHIIRFIPSKWLQISCSGDPNSIPDCSPPPPCLQFLVSICDSCGGRGACQQMSCWWRRLQEWWLTRWGAAPADTVTAPHSGYISICALPGTRALLQQSVCVSYFYSDEYLEASLVFSHSVTITVDVTHDSEHLTIRKCCARSELTHGSKRVVATII